MGSKGEDAKYFTRGKIQEFRDELHAAEAKDKKFTKRKTVLKKIVANITMGNDMSPLYTDVVQCLAIPSLEIKKMVYLFLVSYGRARSDQIQFAIPNFLQDCHDLNPLIRALAIRTMSYIPLPTVVQALKDPLRHCLRDKDPYVRKTAAICVTKLYVFDPRLVEKEGYLDLLRRLLDDVNATVVSNAVAALTEISDRSDIPPFKMNLTIASKLIQALGESSEWGQVYILDSLLLFVPQDPVDAELLAERVLVQLQHANSAVVLTAIKVLLYFLNYTENRQLIDHVCKKMGPPLVTMLSSGPEIQYVALRNILLIIQRRPLVLKNDVKVFFCKYNDPIYVKLAKLEIIYRLAREENSREVLAELTEYSTEVDIDFVRKAVRSIGRVAIKVEAAAQQCIESLLSLLETKVTYVVQEAIIVIKDIFRRYPGQYERIIPTLCEHMDALDEPESKASMVWILGQYADVIENVDELLDDLLYSFLDESVEVQLALLTAAVKLFIHKAHSQTTKDLVHKVLKWATEEVDNPDLRDRGFMYWRLLATDPGGAGQIVLSEKPPITTDADRMDRGALDQLLLHTGTLGSIYHKNPETFIRSARGKALADSPALNQKSKVALIPLIHSNRVSAFSAPTGIEPPPEPRLAVGSASQIPEARESVLSPPLEQRGLMEETHSDHEDGPITGDANDPYSQLDSVFGGGYSTDPPQPRAANRKLTDDEDLLF